MEKRRSSLNQVVNKSTDIFGGGGNSRALVAEPERHQQITEDGSGHQNHPLLAKLKVETPLCEEEKREPLEEPKVGQALKSRLDRIKQEVYATS